MYFHALTGGDDSGLTMPPCAPSNVFTVCVCVWEKYANHMDTHMHRRLATGQSAMHGAAHARLRHTLVCVTPPVTM